MIIAESVEKFLIALFSGDSRVPIIEYVSKTEAFIGVAENDVELDTSKDKFKIYRICQVAGIAQTEKTTDSYEHVWDDRSALLSALTPDNSQASADVIINNKLIGVELTAGLPKRSRIIVKNNTLKTIWADFITPRPDKLGVEIGRGESVTFLLDETQKVFGFLDGILVETIGVTELL